MEKKKFVGLEKLKYHTFPPFFQPLHFNAKFRLVWNFLLSVGRSQWRNSSNEKLWKMIHEKIYLHYLFGVWQYFLQIKLQTSMRFDIKEQIIRDILLSKRTSFYNLIRVLEAFMNFIFQELLKFIFNIFRCKKLIKT